MTWEVLTGLTIDKKPLEDYMEAVGHKEAFEFVSELVKEKQPLSESIIRQIHYLVLADKTDDRGVYRRVPVRIMGAKHEPAIPKPARFHIEFEGIHPFIDGNATQGHQLKTAELAVCW